MAETQYQNHTDRPGVPALRLKRGLAWDARFEEVATPRGNGFLLEAERFAELIAGRDPSALEQHREVSLDVLASMTALLESAKRDQPVLVAPRG